MRSLQAPHPLFDARLQHPRTRRIDALARRNVHRVEQAPNDSDRQPRPFALDEVTRSTGPDSPFRRGWDTGFREMSATPEPLVDTRSARPIAVTAFVDWNSQIHNAKGDRLDPVEKAKRTLRGTLRAVRRVLAREEPARRFDVALRLYHGWHKGWEKSVNLRAIMETVAEQGFPAVYSAPNVLFRQAVGYGHTLLHTLPERRHAGHQIHLANTLRWRTGRPSREEEEKMVDTALAADLLQWARESPSEWALVLAEDDDVVPPVFTAEAWIKAHGGRAFIVRTRQYNQYLRLGGLWRPWKT